jgi:hypothetical protein
MPKDPAQLFFVEPMECSPVENYRKAVTGTLGIDQLVVGVWKEGGLHFVCEIAFQRIDVERLPASFGVPPPRERRDMRGAQV